MEDNANGCGISPRGRQQPDRTQWLKRVAARVNGLASDAGAATAEYAIATLAAVGLAGLLVVILRSDEVRGMLTDIVRRALSVPG